MRGLGFGFTNPVETEECGWCMWGAGRGLYQGLEGW